MANLIIDIGNTALKAAWADGMTLGKTFRYQGERKLDFILRMIRKSRPEKIILSSVKTFSYNAVQKLRAECDTLIVADEILMEKYGIPSYLTTDRAASVVISRYLFKGRKCSVFDFGTSLTVDFLDEEGNHMGGNVSPGCRTRFKALHRYSKPFPLLDAPGSIQDAGTDIASSLTSGVITGMMFEIDGYISRYPENINVFTGGDAIYFAKRMKNSIFVVCNLVLMGLALIAVEYDKKD